MTVSGGKTRVIPNLSVAGTPTTAQQMVTLLTTAIKALAATQNKQVNINGQEFQRQDLKQYQEQLVFWQAQVISEKRSEDAARGAQLDGMYPARFKESDSSNYPYGVRIYGPY